MNRLRGSAFAVGAGTAALALSVLTGVPPSGPVPAAAHAIVLESVPPNDAVLSRAPERVLLRFNSKIETRLSHVTLSAEGGAPVRVAITDGATGESGPDRLVIPLHPLAAGRYVIRYRVLSVDGHVTEGALRFRVSVAH